MIGFWRRQGSATITKDSLAAERLFLLWRAWAEMWHFLISSSHQTIFRQKVKVRYLVLQSWKNYVFLLNKTKFLYENTLSKKVLQSYALSSDLLSALYVYLYTVYVPDIHIYSKHALSKIKVRFPISLGSCRSQKLSEQCKR